MEEEEEEEEEKMKTWDPSSFITQPPTNCGLRPERYRSLIDIQTQQQQQVDTRTTKTNPNCFFEK
jgi:hypothetical protein